MFASRQEGDEEEEEVEYMDDVDFEESDEDIEDAAEAHASGSEPSGRHLHMVPCIHAVCLCCAAPSHHMQFLQVRSCSNNQLTSACTEQRWSVVQARTREKIWRTQAGRQKHAASAAW